VIAASSLERGDHVFSCRAGAQRPTPGILRLTPHRIGQPKRIGAPCREAEALTTAAAPTVVLHLPLARSSVETPDEKMPT